MKKTTILGIVAVVSTFIFAMPAMAATTVSLSPASINVTAGRSFEVVVAVNPQGASNYAEKVEVDFPANNLEVTSFSLGNNWMALTQDDTDSTDNSNGVLIKTAGYPGGISGATTFGTITFHAKGTGSGTIRIGNGSFAYTITGQEAVAGNEAVFAISASTFVPVNNSTTVPTESTTVATNTAATTQAAIQPVSNTQAAAAAGASSLTVVWAIIIVIVLLILLGLYVYWKRTRDQGGDR